MPFPLDEKSATKTIRRTITENQVARSRKHTLDPTSSNVANAVHSRSQILLSAVLVGTAILTYANSFAGVFLFDDIIRIVEEGRIQRLWPIGPLLTGERPVVDLSLAFNYALGELNPWGYHAFNLAVHILAGLTLFGIVRRTILLRLKFKVQSSKKDDEPYSDSIDNRQLPTPSPLRGEGRGEGRSLTHRESSGLTKSSLPLVPPARGNGYLVAFAVAMIFLVHPLQTQSVTYVIQRGESMMGLFYLVTLYCAIRAIDSSRCRLWYFAAIVACALGMATKAVMVTAPLMIILYDWVFLEKAQSPVGKKTGRVGRAHHRRWALYASLCSTWVVLWICGIVPEVMGQSSGTSHVGFSYKGLSALEYAATQPGVIVKYLQLALWPASLCLDYDWPVATNWRQVISPALVILTLLGITVWLLWRRHWLGFVGAWFFLILAPTSSIVPIKDLIFEHRMYLPLAAVIAAVVVPIGLWLSGASKQMGNGQSPIGNLIDNRPSTIDNSWPAIIFAIITVAFAAPLTYGTYRRNRVYHSELTMWTDVVAKRPNNARGYVGVGVEMIESGNLPEAIANLRKALALKNAYADGHYNLAIALAATGLHAEAVNEFLATVQLNPIRTDALINAAQSLDKMGDHGRAAQMIRQAIRIKPTEGDYHYQLANALADSGDVAAAKASFEDALRLKPDHASARINLGNLYLQENRIEDAQAMYRQVLARNPDNSTANVNLGRTLLQQERWIPALQAFRRVPSSDPLAAESKFGAGWALSRLDQREEAKAELREALRIDPGHTAVAAELAKLEADKRQQD